MRLTPKQHLIVDRKMRNSLLLRNIGDTSSHLLARERTRILSIDEHTPRRWLGDTRQQIEQRRLACSVVAKDRKHRGRMNMER